jgi:hypothetical protein
MKAILILVVTVFGLPFFALSQEELPKRPAHFKIEFENESILVLRIRLDPHEKTPMARSDLAESATTRFDCPFFTRVT